jgi:hypothetical protein
VPRVSAFARVANGAAAPLRVIEGQATKLSRTMHGLAFDATNDEIVVPVALGGALLFFKGDAKGEEPPVRVIQGSRTGLIRPQTVAVDAVHNEVVTGDPSMRAVYVYDRRANGNVAPLRVISGKKTGLLDIVGVAVDPVRNVIVASSRMGNGPTGLFVFDRLAQGDVAPKAYIGGPKSKLAHFRQVAVDPESGNIYLGQQGTSYERPSVYTLDKPRENAGRDDDDTEGDEAGGHFDRIGFLAVYAPDDNGDMPPRAIIKGPGIRFAGAAGVALNPKKGEIYIVGGNGFSSYLVPDFFGDMKKRSLPMTQQDQAARVP